MSPAAQAQMIEIVGIDSSHTKREVVFVKMFERKSFFFSLIRYIGENYSIYMLSGLSGIRALAAILVIAYHLNQQLPLDGLSGGVISVHNLIARLSIVVSVFFFLSGFFRSMSYWKVTDTPEKMPQFWSSLKDRFLRIAPAYYVAIVLSILATVLIH